MSAAPVTTPNPSADEADLDEPAPRIDFTPRKVAVLALFVVLALAALYLLLPQLAGLEETWHRIEEGSPLWLAVALAFAFGMFGGYVALFQGIFGRASVSLSYRESYQITMASLAATRLFSAGGAGGLILMAWALRRSGMRRKTVADTTVSFIVLTYLVYMTALIVGGFGLHFGLFPGADPFAITFIPALLALLVTVFGLSIGFVPTDLQERLFSSVGAGRGGFLQRWSVRLAGVPASISSGMRLALGHVRRRDPALLGAIGFWAAQILCLWACFRAFGESPAVAVLVVGFFVGMLGNLLPLPGGIGGVDGGLIGAFVAFGVDFGLAAVAVLVYRGFTFWLPTLPGVIAYLQLRRTVERWRAERRRTPAAA